MKVSVCLASYNGAQFIGEMLESVLAQLTLDDELILADDGSTDTTLEVVERFSDCRIRVLDGDVNLGYSANFARAFSVATGEIIVVADQDDVWLPGRLERMKQALEHADLVVGDAQVVDGELNLLHQSHFRRHGVRPGFLQNFWKTRYVGACMGFRRDLLRVILPLPSRTDLCAYDYWLTIICERYFAVELIPEPLLLYRRHGGNASNGGLKSTNGFVRKVWVRIYSLLVLWGRRGRARDLRRARRG